MSACPYGLCDGSGVIVSCPEPMAGCGEHAPCRCAPIDSPAGPVEEAPAIDGKRLDTDEARQFWARAESNAADVATWPAQKRHAVSSGERVAEAPAVDPVKQAQRDWEAAAKASAEAFERAVEARRKRKAAEKAAGGGKS